MLIYYRPESHDNKQIINPLATDYNPLKPWDGVKDALSYGYVCPLLTNDPPRGELYVPHRFWPMDENCLNLNVWTPGTDDKKRPVLVWLHGGGYEAGSAIEHIAYDGANLSRCGDTVVVSINHRGDDIIAALRWVKANIAAFGGDPENVTVFGQSGGGAKVTTLLQSPAADGLYAKGIVMSGVIGPVLADATGSGMELAEAVMKELGIHSVKELEKADYAAFARAYLKVRPALQKAGKYTGGAPHPNAFYLGDPLFHGFRKETAQIPLLVGSVFGEFTSFAPLPYDRETLSEDTQEGMIRKALGEEIANALIPLFREAYPERKTIDLLRLDFVFRAPEIRYIRERSRLNSSTWSYLFNQDQPIDGGNTPWHCCDIPYFFRNIDLVEYPHGDQSEPDLAYRLQDEAFGSLLAFARTGNPKNAAVPEWPACRPGREAVLVIDRNTRVKENFDHRLQEACVRSAEEIIRRMSGNAGDIQH